MSLEIDLEELNPRPREYLVPYLGNEWYLERVGKKIDMKQKVKEIDPEIKYELLRATISMGVVQSIEVFGLALGAYYLISQLTN